VSGDGALGGGSLGAPGGPAHALGAPRLHLRTVGSTNARAQTLAKGGAPHGTLVTAGEQTAGHGRQGRAWVTPPGRALACSLVLRDPPALLPLLAGVAVAEVAEAYDRERRGVAIKWPNDVLLDGRKVAGILAEGRPQEGWIVLGIGLNVALDLGALPAEVREIATSLGGAPAEVEGVLTALLDALARWLAVPADELLAAYRARDVLAGREVRWSDGQGTALGVADDGRLRVRDTAGAERLLDAGEVHLGTTAPA
jgi:BirA family transcriptional regulator, biotin operon repressor / biotin---[acetyl-CoA-carboxylase] ligase